MDSSDVADSNLAILILSGFVNYDYIYGSDCTLFC